MSAEENRAAFNLGEATATKMYREAYLIFSGNFATPDSRKLVIPICCDAHAQGAPVQEPCRNASDKV